MREYRQSMWNRVSLRLGVGLGSMRDWVSGDPGGGTNWEQIFVAGVFFRGLAEEHEKGMARGSPAAPPHPLKRRPTYDGKMIGARFVWKLLSKTDAKLVIVYFCKYVQQTLECAVACFCSFSLGLQTEDRLKILVEWLCSCNIITDITMSAEIWHLGIYNLNPVFILPWVPLLLPLPLPLLLLPPPSSCLYGLS